MEATEPNMPRFTSNSVFIRITYPTYPLLACGALYSGRSATLNKRDFAIFPDYPDVPPAESLSKVKG